MRIFEIKTEALGIYFSAAFCFHAIGLCFLSGRCKHWCGCCKWSDVQPVPAQCLFAFDAAPCDTGFQSAVWGAGQWHTKKPCYHTDKQNQVGAVQDAGFAIVCRWLYGSWRIGKSCGFAVSGLGAGWVLDLVWRWDRRRADYVGRRTSMYPARCSS